MRRSNVLDFMVKLKEFPRSIIFCINRLIAVTKYLPKSENLKLKLIKIKKQAAKLNEKSTDKQILAILDLLQLSLIDLHIEKMLTKLQTSRLMTCLKLLKGYTEDVLADMQL